MARGDKKDNSISRNSEEFKAWLASIEAMDAEELKESARQNKDALNSEMKAALKKDAINFFETNLSNLAGAAKETTKKRKKRTVLHPILGAVLKFHKDDDDTPLRVLEVLVMHAEEQDSMFLGVGLISQ